MQERRDDHTEEPNALHVLFFYKTIEKILTRKSIMKKIEKHLENKEELSEILKTQDQSLQKVIESAYGDLTEYEREFLSEIRNSHYQEMIEAITDEEFPVPICYATALPYAMYIRQIGLENSYINEEELQKIQEEVKKELLEEDSKLYLFLLEDWIRNHSETKYSYSQTKWMPFIKTLHHEIMHNLFYFYIEKLFINALEKDNFSVIDEDERKIFQETQKKYIDSTIMEKYADFLEARGWPAIANRTRNYAKRIASEEINFPQDSPTKEQNL
jgi:hypothetical protein